MHQKVSGYTIISYKLQKDIGMHNISFVIIYIYYILSLIELTFDFYFECWSIYSSQFQIFDSAIKRKHYTSGKIYNPRILTPFLILYIVCIHFLLYIFKYSEREVTNWAKIEEQSSTGTMKSGFMDVGIQILFRVCRISEYILLF